MGVVLIKTRRNYLLFSIVESAGQKAAVNVLLRPTSCGSFTVSYSGKKQQMLNSCESVEACAHGYRSNPHKL